MLNPQERQQAISRLEKNRQQLKAAVDGLSREELVFCPGEGQWSVADCLEHITLVENAIYQGIQRALTKPPEPEKQAEVAGKVEQIEPVLRDRSRKVAGPPALMPTRQWTSFSEVVDNFESVRARSVMFITETEADLHSHFFPHPMFGNLACSQWLLLMSLHADRHHAQMEEVKAASRKAVAAP